MTLSAFRGEFSRKKKRTCPTSLSKTSTSKWTLARPLLLSLSIFPENLERRKKERNSPFLFLFSLFLFSLTAFTAMGNCLSGGEGSTKKKRPASVSFVADAAALEKENGQLTSI